jgi:hypothetical protein
MEDKMSRKKSIIFIPVFVLAGIVILVPTISEKALGVTFAVVHTDWPHTTLILKSYDLPNGRWVRHPDQSIGPEPGGWVTEGPPPFGGTEKGSVTYDIFGGNRIPQTVTLSFFNPASGPNECSATLNPPGFGATAKCEMTGGSFAAVKYIITTRLAIPFISPDIY